MERHGWPCPLALREAYGAAPDADIFAVRAGDGRLIAAMPEAFGAVAERWPATTDDPSYFHLPGLAGKTQDYYGLGISLDSAAGPLSIWVARAAGATALVHSLLEEFVKDKKCSVHARQRARQFFRTGIGGAGARGVAVVHRERSHAPR